ncbi:thiol-disulfide isomerase/thioredoxin [Dysgonomonas alginatilytica]|uniref:Thiol-disulfide isomerase/thioredoxin n=2 Tax=Dysgonomonas alginatilytica TaxID=1605892 RepID=A0A2V3PT72_9BACT|nr:thiol-disulfide isomerase/thioredoxin [Dysgonomonas alginatilytica]
MGICIAFLSCTSTNKDQFPEPKIMMATAKVTGVVRNFQLKEGEEKPVLKLYVPAPITAEVGTFETYLTEDGSFSFEVPIECNMIIGTITSEIFDQSLIIGLASDKETKLVITKKDDNNIDVTILSRIGLTSNDVLNSGDVMEQMMSPGSTYSSFYKMTPKDFASVAIKNMEERLNITVTDSTLSKGAKNFITNEFKLAYLVGCLLDYTGYMSLNYQNFKTEEEPEEFTPQEPDRSYYAFLKYFDLNNPQYLYNATYSRVLKAILSNETLNIPLINDTPIDEWLKGVKTTMADLIGSDNGLFYDRLTAGAYISQFDNELKPLSDKQIENIRNYFKNKEITKILLKKNEEVIKLAAQKSNANCKETPSVPQKELMNAIISQYKGNVVLVDFWATWCGPCMSAMKEIREIKGQYKDKNIVFVYITNTSSPLTLWKKKINTIGGEHYYLTEGEWESLQDSFDFTGIPTYQLYDTNGKLEKQFSGYPGTNKMKAMIDQLLP